MSGCKNPDRPRPGDCMRECYGFADVSVPVELRPNTVIGSIETECCGDPDITCEHESGNGRCCIVLTQRVRIKIPIDVGVSAVTGCSSVSCDICGADGTPGNGK